MPPIISIVLPAYNAEDYIGETIESVLSQSYQNWELIIVDDKSTDNTLNIAQKYVQQDGRIKVIVLNENTGGPAKPRNEGIKLSQGKFIAFLDADDVWVMEKLEIQLSYLLNNEYNFVSSGMIPVDKTTNELPHGNIIKKFFSALKSKRSKCDLIKYRFIINSSVVVAKKFLSDFEEGKEFKAVEDLCMWLKLLSMERVKYKYINSALVKYRILDTSISDRNSSYKQDTKANLCIAKHIFEYNDFKSYKCFYAYSALQYLRLLFK